MKRFTKTALLATLISVSASFAILANAAFVSNDNQNLTECRELVKAEFGNVDRIKVANIKSRSHYFTAKFKVFSSGERAIVSCKLARDQVAAISCLKGDACAANGVALSTK